MTKVRLVLASASPRRRQILSLLGQPFDVAPAATDETPMSGETPEQTAERLATEKAGTARRGGQEGVIVAADTIVVLDARVLGKPSDRAEARWMLTALRGRPHLVITGVAVLDTATGKEAVASRSTTVWMRNYGDAEIERYIDSGEPFDKAGAYAIQDEVFRPVERIEGCYLNVVGLPLCDVTTGLRAVGFPVDPVPARAREQLCDECPERQKK